MINGNTIYDNAYIGIHVNGDASEGGTGLVTNALIENNLIYNNGQNGINADGLQNSTIENNLIYNYASYGICLYQSDAGGPSINNVIVNNTIDSGTSTGTDGAIRILDSSTGNTILNNILQDGSTIAYRIAADSISGTVSNHNIVPSGAQVQSDDTGAEEPFSQWQSSTGQDQNSLTATPAQLFVNPSANNYQELSTSPSIGAGTSTDAPSTDILGNPRPSSNGYDIGCYEYETSTSAPTVAETARATNGRLRRHRGTFNEPVTGTTASRRRGTGATVTYSTHATPTTPTALATRRRPPPSATPARRHRRPIGFRCGCRAAAAPTVTSETPASGATSVAMSMVPTATFNEAVQASTISFTLKSSSGSSVAGSVSCNSTTNVTTFTPTSALASTHLHGHRQRRREQPASHDRPFSWSLHHNRHQCPDGSSRTTLLVNPVRLSCSPVARWRATYAVVLLTWNTSQSGRTPSAPTGWSTVAQNVTVANWNTEGESVIIGSFSLVIHRGNSP